MRLAILLILQVLLFLPLTGFAADMGKAPLLKNHKTTEVTEAKKAGLVKTYGNLPLYFIENKGQVESRVKFYERGAGHATFFTSKGVVISLTKRDGKVDRVSFNDGLKELKSENDKKVTTEALTLSFVGADKEAKITADNKMPGRVNYFVGNDKTKWQSNIPTFGAVTYKDVYKDIDVKFYGNNRNLEHDVIVRPHGDISKVRFAYKGIQGLKINKAGDLEVSLKAGKLIEQRPVIYQEIGGKRVVVDGSYKLLGEKDGAFEYGFDVASYDHSKKIVIDPVLAYSTFLGGSGNDFPRDIAVDASGNAYITGNTNSTDFPLKNPLTGAKVGGEDIFVTKINAAGSALVYSTYLGGVSDDLGFGIAVDATGNAYVTGNTGSLDFPLKNPIQGANMGAEDAFVTKINAAGSALVYSTYLGGTDADFGKGIAVDATGNAYVTGLSFSLDFLLMNPIQATFGGGLFDAFVTKINPTGSALVYSTYLGGTGNDSASDIAVYTAESAYITGKTDSPNFPLMNPMQATFGGGLNDAFVTKINPTGSALVYSTYLGGTSDDIGKGIAVNNSGSAYVTGQTMSADFPLVTSIQALFAGLSDGFISKFDPTGVSLLFSSFFGGTLGDSGNGIALDLLGNAYVTGDTNSTDFPLVKAIQGLYGGGSSDSFVLKIKADYTTYEYSTYLGGSHDDMSESIAVDPLGNAIVIGYTSSTLDFPLINPLQATFGGSFTDAFVSKIGVAAPPPPMPAITLGIMPDAATVAQGLTLGYNVTATNTTASRQCFQYWENVWLPGGGVFPATGSLINPVPRVCLNAGVSKMVHLTHGVPLTAPLGAYVFNSYVGIFPFSLRQVVDTTSFNFDITPFFGPLTNRPATSWGLVENGFRK